MSKERRTTPQQAVEKYRPVLELVEKKGINFPQACQELNVPYAAFISWKRRQDSANPNKVDGRTLRYKNKEKVKAFKKKNFPELVTVPLPQPEKKKDKMVMIIGDSSDIFKALQTINFQGE